MKNLIDKLVDKKFKEAEEEWHKIQEIDKKQIKEDLMWKYRQLVEEIEKLWEERTIDKKIDELIRRLEKIDKLEYKEIIERLEDYKEKVLKEKGNANKNNFNILKQQNDWQNWN